MSRVALVLLPALALAGCNRPAAPDKSSTSDPAVAKAEAADLVCPAPAAGPFADALVHLGRAEGHTFIEPTDVIHRGTTVFACAATRGLVTWDVSDPGAGKLLAEKVGPQGLAHKKFPRCQNIALDAAGTTAVIANRGDEVQMTPFLWMYDVADPKAPKPLRGWSGKESIEGVTFAGPRLVAAAHRDGVLVFEASGAGLKPTLRHADARSSAWDVAVLGEHVVVAEDFGLRLYRLTDESLEPASVVELDGSSKDVELDGNTAYVATSVGFAIVDLSDPSAPSILSQTETTGAALGVDLGRPDALIVTDWTEIRAYDVSDPTKPRLTASDTVPSEGPFSRVLALDAGADGKIYVGEWQGLHVYDHEGDAPSPEITASPTSLRFGTVAAGSNKTSSFEVFNEGTQPLTITDASSANDFFAVQPRCARIEPGHSKLVRVTFSPLGDGPVASTVNIRSDDPDEPELVLTVSGNAEGLGPGDPVPEFALVDLDGKQWTHDDLTGKITLLAYFATF